MTREEFIEKFFPRKTTNPDTLTSCHVFGILAHASLYDIEVSMVEYPQQLKDLAISKYIQALESVKNAITKSLNEIQETVIIDLVKED